MEHKKIGLLFAGQGVQKVGMGLDFYNTYPQVREIYDSVDPAIKEVCFYGPQEKLDETKYTQVALLLTSLAIVKTMEYLGVKAEVLAGLSLGEYSALTFAHVFTVEDAMHVVNQRADIMSKALENTDSTMMAVLNASLETIKEVCTHISQFGVCEIANINSPNQVVITGHRHALEKAKEILVTYKGVRVLPLNVSGAFHSSLLNEASKQLKKVLEPITIHPATCPVVFNVSGKVEDQNIKELLVKQIKSTVLFQDTLQHMIDLGVNVFVEISPKATLSGFVRKIDPSIPCYCVSDVESLHQLMEVL